MSTRPRVVAAYPQLVLGGVAVVTTCLVYLRYFAGLGFLTGLLVAAALGTVVGAVAGLRRFSMPLTIAVALLGFALVGIFAVYRSTLRHGIPTLDTLRGLGTGVVSGWARMLSVNLPADPAGDLVLTPALLTWIAAVSTAILVSRTKSLLAPVLPPLLLLAAGLVLTAARPVGGLVLIGGVLVVVLMLALVRSSAADPLAGRLSTRVTVTRLLFGLPVVVLAAAGGVAGMKYVPLAGGHDRFDLREVVPVPLDVQDGISPLVTLKSQLRADPARTLFTVRMSGDTAGIDRIRTVALDDYDGALWTSDDRFLLAGHELGPTTDLTDPGRVSINVTIRDLPGPYLPELGSPAEVSAPRVGYSKESGTLATDATLSGLSYDLTAQVARRGGLDAAVPAVTSDRDTALPPGLPVELRDAGARLAGAVARPYAKLLAIQDHLRKLPYNVDSRPGHSYDALRRLFDSNPADQVGYAEQYAAAFTVLARSQGFPARVAVGYLLNPKERTGDTYTVSTADAHAWPEVNLAGYGWVPFEPTDRNNVGAPAPEQPEAPQGGEDQKNVPDQQQAGAQPSEDPNLPKVASGVSSFVDWALWVLVGLGVLVVLTPVAVATEKFRRRRLRRSGSRVARIIGAWQQSVDRLIEIGVPVTANLTAGEVAHHAHQRVGTSAGAVAVLAPIVTAAVFNPAEPAEAVVAEAWGLEARLRRELRAARGPLALARGYLDPRPLFARRVDERRRRHAMESLTRG